MVICECELNLDPAPYSGKKVDRNRRKSGNFWRQYFKTKRNPFYLLYFKWSTCYWRKLSRAKKIFLDIKTCFITINMQLRWLIGGIQVGVVLTSYPILLIGHHYTSSTKKLIKFMWEA